MADRGAVGLLDEVLGAHGGAERWAATRAVTATVRTGGLLPRTRMPGNRFAEVRVTAAAHEPRLVAEPFPREGERAVFEHGAARIETSDGEVLDSRERPRDSFSGLAGLRRNLRWDALDSAYFAGYALWNYLTEPFLFLQEGVEVAEGEPWAEGEETWRRLEVTFPSSIDTHSARQTFYFDALRLLRRHDYVAEVVGGWAHAAHLTSDHTDAGGLVFPTRRRVHPIGPRNRALGFPTLVSLDLSEIRVETG